MGHQDPLASVLTGRARLSPGTPATWEWDRVGGPSGAGGELLGWSWGESDLPWWEMLCVWGGCLARGGKQTTMGPSCVQQACVLQVRTPKT